MLSIHDAPTRLCDGVNRREVMRVGSLALSGLSLPTLFQSQAAAAPSNRVDDRAFGRAKNVIFLYLAGGPPQHETFDPKPHAPDGIRGPFNPISTNIPGMQFCELLPRTAALADKLAVVRSMATDDNVHSSSSAWVLTGYKYRGPNARTISPTDWPYFGSIVKMLRRSESLPGLTTAWLPDVMRLNENVTPAGQTAGFLGTQWNPEVFVGDPSQAKYEIESLRSTDVTPLHLSERRTLLSQLESRLQQAERSVQVYDSLQQQAFDLLTSGRARSAFDVAREPDAVRDRYGRNRWGQCVLLARRLIEAGVRLVHVQWPREPGDNAVDNPLWDTHAQNADRVEDVLCPMFDVGFSALIDDLDQRGLLDETLVVAIGEFGRTPKINAKGGRDHWGPVFSFAMAGAGISGGQVYGSSDKNGAYPATDRVEPGELTATIFHLLGIDYHGTFPDRQGRPHHITQGEPLWKLLGSEPATSARIASTGEVARVPAYDPTRLLANTDFSGADVLKPVSAPSRPKGWRAFPFADDGDSALKVQLDRTAAADRQSVILGLTGEPTRPVVTVAPGSKAWIAQEVISPFAGTYRLRVTLRGEGASDEFYDEVFQKNFHCRLIFFKFNAQTKKASEITELASITVSPDFHNAVDGGWQTFELSKRFENPTPGGNFSFGAGMGVAVQIETSTSDDLLLVENDRQTAFIRVASVELDFVGKGINDKVTV